MINSTVLGAQQSEGYRVCFQVVLLYSGRVAFLGSGSLYQPQDLGQQGLREGRDKHSEYPRFGKDGKGNPMKLNLKTEKKFPAPLP